MSNKQVNTSEKKLLEFLESEGYTDLRTLEDGSIVGVYKMLFTWGTVVDLDHYGHGGRVCWPTYEQAALFARTMVTIDDAPPPGYTALKRKRDMRQEAVNEYADY